MDRAGGYVPLKPKGKAAEAAEGARARINAQAELLQHMHGVR